MSKKKATYSTLRCAGCRRKAARLRSASGRITNGAAVVERLGRDGWELDDRRAAVELPRVAGQIYIKYRLDPARIVAACPKCLGSKIHTPRTSAAYLATRTESRDCGDLSPMWISTVDTAGNSSLYSLLKPPAQEFSEWLAKVCFEKIRQNKERQRAKITAALAPAAKWGYVKGFIIDDPERGN